MNLAHLQTLVAVVESGSFTGAAKQRGLTQPTVTNHVQSLERELGAVLLDRRGHRAALTEAGEVFLPHARAILARVDEATTALHAQSSELSGPLHLAASSIPGTYLLPRVVAAFSQECPHLDIAIDCTDSTQATAAVADGYAHLAMVGARLPAKGVVFRQFDEDELVVIASPTNPLSEHRNLTYRDLVEQRWIVRPRQSGTRRVIEQTLRAFSVDRTFFDRATVLQSDEAIINAVEGGLGIAMMSSLVAAKALELGTVTRLDMVEGAIKRPLYLVTPSSARTRAADAFIAFIDQGTNDAEQHR